MSRSEQKGAAEGKALRRLPTLQELFCCCDEETLVRIVMDEHAFPVHAGPAPSSKRRRSAERVLRSAVASMRSLPTKRKRGRGRAILPAESFVLKGDTGLIERRVGARLLLADDVAAAARALGSHEAGKAVCEEPLPVRVYSADPWETVLASRVCLDGRWCVRERYLALASAFWEMTFFGFAHDAAVAGRMREEAAWALGSPADSDGLPAAASDLRAERARAFGLAVPDPLDLGYRSASADRVGRLNLLCELDLCRRLVRAAPGLGRVGRQAASRQPPPT